MYNFTKLNLLALYYLQITVTIYITYDTNNITTFLTRINAKQR